MIVPLMTSLLTLGWCPLSEHVVSPHFHDRVEHREVDSIVIHAISLPEGNYTSDAVLEFFTNQLDRTAHPSFESLKGHRVSAHFFIRRNGKIIQFVDTRHVAFHAGHSIYQGREHWNKFSVGIELEGTEIDRFESAQYEALYGLIDWLLMMHPAIKQGFIQGHQDIAPDRKRDPGPYFNWRALRRHLQQQGEHDIQIAGDDQCNELEVQDAYQGSHVYDYALAS